MMGALFLCLSSYLALFLFSKELGMINISNIMPPLVVAFLVWYYTRTWVQNKAAILPAFLGGIVPIYISVVPGLLLMTNLSSILLSQGSNLGNK